MTTTITKYISNVCLEFRGNKLYGYQRILFWNVAASHLAHSFLILGVVSFSQNLLKPSKPNISHHQ